MARNPAVFSDSHHREFARRSGLLLPEVASPQLNQMHRRRSDTSFQSSWPGLSRPVTSFFPPRRKDVDARHEAGHDASVPARYRHPEVRAQRASKGAGTAAPSRVLRGSTLSRPAPQHDDGKDWQRPLVRVMVALYSIAAARSPRFALRTGLLMPLVAS